jgi:hypothetical protein
MDVFAELRRAHFTILSEMAYKRASLQVHPDKTGMGPGSQQRLGNLHDRVCFAFEHGLEPCASKNTKLS